MSADKGRQLRIFVPMDAQHRWSDILIDRVVRPIAESGELDWFWFTRYHCHGEVETNDTQWDQIPRACRMLCTDGKTYDTRSIRFRFAAKTERVEKRIAELCAAHEGWFSDIRDYDPIADLGSMTMLRLCEAACRVVLENLDGTGRIKSEAHFRNLEQMHHRICNIAHLTDYRNLGVQLVNAVIGDLDNYRYDSADRLGPKKI